MSTHAAVVKKFINDPETVVPEALAGIATAHAGLVRVDMEKRQIELALEGILDSVRRDSRRDRRPARASKPKAEQRKGTPQERRRRKQRLGKNARQRIKGKK